MDIGKGNKNDIGKGKWENRKRKWGRLMGKRRFRVDIGKGKGKYRKQKNGNRK